MTQSANRRGPMLLALSFLLLPVPAFADLFVAPFLGVKFGGRTSIVDLELATGEATTTLGASAFLLTDAIIGYEVASFQDRVSPDFPASA